MREPGSFSRTVVHGFNKILSVKRAKLTESLAIQVTALFSEQEQVQYKEKATEIRKSITS
jgi:hypothetical protein